MTEKLKQWKDYLTPKQVAEGMNVARANARRLYEDASLLLNNKSYASAVTLAILSIEESGKIPLLRGIATAVDGKELKTAWKAYRTHTKKTVTWNVFDSIKSGARKLEDFKILFSEDAEHTDIIEDLKQVSLYTDCYGQVLWNNPSEIISESVADWLVNLAGHFAKDRIHTEREIQLWVHHIKPVKNQSLPVMKNALINWKNDMTAEGLMDDKKGIYDILLCNNPSPFR